jgi:MFS family permease
MNNDSRSKIEESTAIIFNHQSLGHVHQAESVTTNRLPPRRARNIIWLLAASVALMMTGFGIIMPVFARRLGEFGDGVEALGLMTMVFALTQLIAAPVLGSLTDRWGRRPFILIALIAFSATNIGYLLAQSTPLFILVRALGGAFTAGLFPAAMGVVADIMPEAQRARWIGMIMGGYGAGFVFGPVLGGFLYDGFGFAAPFAISAILAFLAFIAAAILVPETRPAAVRRREALRQRRERFDSDKLSQPDQQESLWQSLPRPLTVFGTLLFIDFIGSFAFAFIEPQMVFYLYEELNWSTTQFGIVVGMYGLAMVFGQTVLGQMSDRYGRKPIIILGILLSSLLYVMLAFIRSYPLILVSSAIAGLGAALIAPAASAFYLDITARQYRGRIVGIKESILSLGGVLGPLLVIVAARLTTPRGIFIFAGSTVLFGAFLAATLLKKPAKLIEETDNLAWNVNHQRYLAAQATLSGLVMSATRLRMRQETG